MVFIFTAPNPLEIHPAGTKDHAYLNCYPTGMPRQHQGGLNNRTQHTC